MIKTTLKFIVGFIFGAVLAYLLTYLFGFAMESMNIVLYDSESDQQRNFNIFFGFMIVLAIIFGFLATKIGSKN